MSYCTPPSERETGRRRSRPSGPATGGRNWRWRMKSAQAPIITPDPARGAPLYAQNCSVCHGETGGPVTIRRELGMAPAPANLRDAGTDGPPESVRRINPAASGQGVEGTDMPAFADQLDDRQLVGPGDLHRPVSDADPASPTRPTTSSSGPPDTRSQCRLPKARKSPQPSVPGARQPAQVKRGPAQLLDYTATTLDRAWPRIAPVIAIRPMTCRWRRIWKARTGRKLAG